MSLIFNFYLTSNVLFYIQLITWYSIMYLTSNCLFNIQLFIQHSNIHLAFNSSFNIQLFIQQSNFHSINYAWAPNTSSQLREHGLLQTWPQLLRLLQCEQPIRTMTRLSTSMWNLTSQGFFPLSLIKLTRFLTRKEIMKFWSSILSWSIKRFVFFVPSEIVARTSAQMTKNIKVISRQLSLMSHLLCGNI